MSESLGNRIAGAVLAVVVGVVYGLIATVGHQQIWRIGGIEVPWGLVLAVVGVAALTAGIRLLTSGRLAVAACAVGIVGVVAVLTLPGPGGSVLIPGGTIGTIWAIAPALVSVLVVAWPKLPDRTPARA